ncbi:MAG: 4Fe-4S dicluster domain-containing protein [bacterium]|nr:4Fe-4S dicluster domain-containing protein [bacterium]
MGKEFGQYVLEKSRQKVSKCLQCLKCTSGCPIVSWMDYKPNQINRLIQMGDKKKVLSSSIIWLCVGCQTCVTRCPMKIDIPLLMDTLRSLAVKEKVSKKPNITIFHQQFLNSIKRWGRAHELELIGLYKLKSGSLFQDIKLGQEMFLKGKLSILPEIIKGKKEIKEMFSKGNG